MNDVLQRIGKIVALNARVQYKARAYTLRAKQLSVMLRHTINEYLLEHHSDLRRMRGSHTQAELAKRADVPQSYISNVEQGTTDRLSEDALIRILEVYDAIGAKDGSSRTVELR